MTHYMLLALTNAVEGQVAEFNEWYSNTHVHDVQKFPGVRSAARYELVSGKGAESRYKYLAIFEVETDLDPDEFNTKLLDRTGGALMQMSPAFDFDDFQMLMFKPIP